MNEIELKKIFEFYCEHALVKYYGVWEIYYDVLCIYDEHFDFFKSKFDKLVDMLNEDDTELLNMETDDIYDILIEKNKRLFIKQCL